MKTINDILKKADSGLTKLINKAKISADLEPIFKTVLDPDLAKHCHFANYKKSIVTVTVTNTSWATRLRYIIPDIIKNLKVHPEFKNVTNIRYVVKTQELQPKPRNKPTKISADNEVLWRKTMDELKKGSRRL